MCHFAKAKSHAYPELEVLWIGGVYFHGKSELGYGKEGEGISAK